MTCQSISIMARILLIAAGALTTIFLIIGIAQGFTTHTGREKGPVANNIHDFSFTYDGQLPAKVTKVVGLEKGMPVSASLNTRAKDQNIGPQEVGIGGNSLQASPLIGQQLQLTDMSKVGTNRGRPVGTANTYPSRSRSKIAMARPPGTRPRTAPVKAPKSETEILFRKLAKEILTKLFEKFMLKAAPAKSPSGDVGSANTTTRQLRGQNIGTGTPNKIVQAGIGRPGRDRSLPIRPAKPNLSPSPLVQSPVTPKVTSPRPLRDRFSMFNRMAQVQPFELLQLPASPLAPFPDPMQALGRPSTGAQNSTRSPFDLFRQYYQRRRDYDAFEDFGFFGMEM